MFQPIVPIIDLVIRSFANKYISSINIKELPIWRGKAKIDDFILNADGFNSIIVQTGLPIKANSVTGSRVSCKFPIFSPGTTPIKVHLHSFSIDLEITDKLKSIDEYMAQLTELTSPYDSNSFVGKMVSNIILEIDGLVSRVSFSGIFIEVVSTKLQIHIENSKMASEFQDLSLTIQNSTSVAHISIKNLLTSATFLQNNDDLILNQIHTDKKSTNQKETQNEEKQTTNFFANSKLQSRTLTNFSFKMTNASADFSYNFELTNLISGFNLNFEVDHETIHILSKTPICFTIPLSLFQPIFDIFDLLPFSSLPEFIYIWPLFVDITNLSFVISISNELTIKFELLDLFIEKFNFSFTVNSYLFLPDSDPLSNSLGNVSDFLQSSEQLLHDIQFSGTISQKKRKTYIKIEGEELRANFPLSTTLVEALKAIDFSKLFNITLPKFLHFKPSIPSFSKQQIQLRDLPNLKLTKNSIEFEFDDPILPIEFLFFNLNVNYNILQNKSYFITFRYFNSTQQAFIPLSIFDSSRKDNSNFQELSSLRLNFDQILPSTRFQLLFSFSNHSQHVENESENQNITFEKVDQNPKDEEESNDSNDFSEAIDNQSIESLPSEVNIQAIPDLLEKSTFSFLTSISNTNGIIFDFNFKHSVFELSNLNIPVCVGSFSNLNICFNYGPYNSLVSTMKCGFSLLTTNFRNSTMVSLLDIPSLVITILHYPPLPSLPHYPIQKNIYYMKSKAIQKTHVYENTDIDCRFSLFVLNLIPTVIIDLARFMTNFSVKNTIAYKIINESDIPFTYQVSNSDNFIKILPDEKQVITFKPNQQHYLYFPEHSIQIFLHSPGIYKLSSTNYIEIIFPSPYVFELSIKSTLQFVSDLKLPIDIQFKSDEFFETQRSKGIEKSITNDHKLITSSLFSGIDFDILIKIPDLTNWSNSLHFSTSDSSSLQFFQCSILANSDALEGKFSENSFKYFSSLYTISEFFSCWIMKTVKNKSIMNSISDSTQISIIEFCFKPLLMISNKLPVPLITSLSTIPSGEGRYVSFLPEPSIEIGQEHLIQISFPLKKLQPIPRMIHNIPSIIEAIPQCNMLAINPSFIFRNQTTLSLHFRISNHQSIRVESGQQGYLPQLIDPNILYVGFADNNHSLTIHWSKGLQLPTTTSFTIQVEDSFIELNARINEYCAIISPQFIAVNQTDHPIWIAPHTKMEPNSEVQLLIWRNKDRFASFGLISPKLSENELNINDFSGGFESKKNADLFSSPISLLGHETWKRIFVKNTHDQNLYYLTYSVQSTSIPYTIVFHSDPSPPFIVENLSNHVYTILYPLPQRNLPANVNFFSPSRKEERIIIPAKKTTYFPFTPEALTILRNIPFTTATSYFKIPLQYSLQTILNDERQSGSDIFATVSKNGHQTCVTLTHDKESINKSLIYSHLDMPKQLGNLSIFNNQAIHFSLFILNVKIPIYSDIENPGTLLEEACITISPTKIFLYRDKGPNALISGNVIMNDFQIDSVMKFEKFPVILEKLENKPFLYLGFELKPTFNGNFGLKTYRASVPSFKLNVEESLLNLFIKFFKSLTSLEEEDLIKEFQSHKSRILHPGSNKGDIIKLIPFHCDHIILEPTTIILSLYFSSYINADFKNVPIHFSLFEMKDKETFIFILLNQLFSHFASDVVAAIPSFLPCFSLFGSPFNVISNMTDSLYNFYFSLDHTKPLNEAKIHELVLIFAKGFQALISGFGKGSLQSLAMFSDSMENTLKKIVTPKNIYSESVMEELVKRLNFGTKCPIEGFRENGMTGFTKGTGHMIMNFVVSPIVAFFAYCNLASEKILKSVGAENENHEDRRIEKKRRELSYIPLDV